MLRDVADALTLGLGLTGIDSAYLDVPDELEKKFAATPPRSHSRFRSP
jgi:hypothetical protein